MVGGQRFYLHGGKIFAEFYNIRPADVTITVGGDHRLTCTKVGDLTVS